MFSPQYLIESWERAMVLNCEKCDGENDVTKYCLDCKKSFCHKVKTVKLIKVAPKLFDATNNCPNCGRKIDE